MNTRLGVHLVAPVVGRLGGFPWHPFALSGAWFLDQYLVVLVHPAAAIRPGTAVVAIAGLVVALAWIATRNRHAGGALASVVILIFLSPRFVATIGIAVERLPVVVLVLGVLALLVTALVVRMAIRLRHRLTWPVVTRRLNVFTLLLLGVVVAGGVLRGLPQTLAGDLTGPRASAGGGQVATAANPRDIFILLLDAYPRADTLERVFAYDNRPFLDELRARGLDVAERSRSNYWFTDLTLASMFNMRQLPDIPELADVIEGSRPSRPVWRQVMNDSRAFAILRASGYRIVTTASGWEDVSLRRADTFLDGGQPSDFEVALLRSTWLADVVQLVRPDLIPGLQHARIDFNFDVVMRIAAVNEDRPTFVFSHVPAPHVPIAVDAAGQTVSWDSLDVFYGVTLEQLGLSAREYRDRFISQLEYVNGRVLETIDSILAGSDREAVIIVMSDHGPGNHTRPLRADRVDVRARLLNLFAAYTPGNHGLFPEGTTPVNVLVRLFNAYLGTDLNLQPDTSYRSSVFGTENIYQELAPLRTELLEP